MPTQTRTAPFAAQLRIANAALHQAERLATDAHDQQATTAVVQAITAISQLAAALEPDHRPTNKDHT